jgi:hypothetical protein
VRLQRPYGRQPLLLNGDVPPLMVIVPLAFLSSIASIISTISISCERLWKAANGNAPHRIPVSGLTVCMSSNTGIFATTISNFLLHCRSRRTQIEYHADGKSDFPVDKLKQRIPVKEETATKQRFESDMPAMTYDVFSTTLGGKIVNIAVQRSKSERDYIIQIYNGPLM